jgi:hypothetical protein
VVTGAVVGAAAGAAVATANAPTSTTYVYPSSGVYVSPPVTTYVAPTVVAPVAYPIGYTTSVLPAGFNSVKIGANQYYQNGTTWFQMNVGPTGVFFVVVPTP